MVNKQSEMKIITKPQSKNDNKATKTPVTPVIIQKFKFESVVSDVREVTRQFHATAGLKKSV